MTPASTHAHRYAAQYSPRGPVGEVVTATLAAAAAMVVARYGPGIIAAVWDEVEGWLGINTCSPENIRKYERIVEGMTIEQLRDGLATGKIASSTGTCREVALKLAAARVTRLAREAGIIDRAGNPIRAEEPLPQDETERIAVLESQVRRANERHTAVLRDFQRLQTRRLHEMEAAYAVLSELGIDWPTDVIGHSVPLAYRDANETMLQAAERTVPGLRAKIEQARQIASRLGGSGGADDDEGGGVLGHILSAGVGFFAGRASKGSR